MKKAIKLIPLVLLISVCISVAELNFQHSSVITELDEEEMRALVGRGCTDKCDDVEDQCEDNSSECTSEGGDCVVCSSQSASECSSGGGAGCDQGNNPCVGRSSFCIEMKGGGLGCGSGGSFTACGSSPSCN